jgi:uncharacterized protein YjbJ (UPF0337 family)
MPHTQRQEMKESTKDTVQGGAKVIKGKVKEAAGALTGSNKLKSEGKSDQIAGKVQKKVGQIEKVLGT